MAKTTYTIEDGQFYRQVEHENGKIVRYPICNFVAWITNEKIENDGRRFFRIEGELNDGSSLKGFWLQIYPPPTFTPGLISQIGRAWGIKAHVFPGSGKIANLKSAIKWYSLHISSVRGELRQGIKIW
jgi:hypothetical protein